MPTLTDADFAALSESFPAFVERYRIPLFDWQGAAFGEAARREFYPATDGRPAGRYFAHPLSGVSVPRGNGKSFGAAAVGTWRLIFGPPRLLILSAALDYEGAKVIQDHAKTMLRARGLDQRLVDVRADELIGQRVALDHQIQRAHRLARTASRRRALRRSRLGERC